METQNVRNQRRGLIAKQILSYYLELAERLNYIRRITPDYKVGRPGFQDQHQFKAHYLIEFDDDSKWILFNTTSIRDRVKEQYWDSYNFKDLDPLIKRAFLVYPDNISPREKRTAISKNNKIHSGGEYSTIDGIVSQGKLFNLIEEYALRDKTPGQIHDIKGRNFEVRVAAILSNPWNLQKAKSGDPTIDGLSFDFFDEMITELDVDLSIVSEIRATADKNVIGFLPSGGNPKTDVLVNVTYDNNSEEYRTISCKRSRAHSVSVHQYDADAFSSTLAPEDDNLHQLLLTFQHCGNLRDFGQRNIERLTAAMVPYKKLLALWALGGFGGEGNDIQCANYILTYNSDMASISIHRITDYYEMLCEKGVNGHFGTIFDWTFPSRRKGKSIQLKTKIL